jgi:hypothetical protein
MTTLRIDIAGNPRTIPFRDMLNVQNSSLAILDDLDHALSGRQKGTVEWIMRDLSMNGHLRIEVYSKVREMKRKKLDDFSARIAGSFVHGMRMLEKEGRSPEYLSYVGMGRVEKMTSVIGHNGTDAIVASIPEDDAAIEITQRAHRNLQELIPEAYKSVGAIEGVMEAISVHKRRIFIVYEALFDKAVTCEFGGLELLERVKESLGRRVRVRGIVSRNSRSEPRSVQLENESDFQAFEHDLKVLPFRSLGGSDPGYTGGLSTEEYIRRIRG